MAKKFFLLPILAIFTLTIFFGTLSNKLVRAETGTNIRGDLQDRPNIRQQDLRDNSATRQAELRQRAVGRIKGVFDKILSRFQAALERLDKIAAKLQSRINKLKEKGIDVSNAESILETCSTKKGLAEAAVADSKTRVAAIDASSQTVRQSVKTAVDAIHSAKKAIRDYHKCLADVTRNLKASQKSREATHEAE